MYLAHSPSTRFAMAMDPERNELESKSTIGVEFATITLQGELELVGSSILCGYVSCGMWMVLVDEHMNLESLHPEVIDGRPGTYVVDVPEGITKDETCYFVDALINCNPKSLVHMFDFEPLALQDCTELINST
ncbi:hypothetical protein QQ045_009418 [Rhodiola kirilowii]